MHRAVVRTMRSGKLTSQRVSNVVEVGSRAMGLPAVVCMVDEGLLTNNPAVNCNACDNTISSDPYCGDGASEYWDGSLLNMLI